MVLFPLAICQMVFLAACCFTPFGVPAAFAEAAFEAPDPLAVGVRAASAAAVIGAPDA